jgi:hypothetical protein
MRAHRAVTALVVTAALAGAAAAGCARDSYIVATLVSGDTPFTGVTAVDVTVSGIAGHDAEALPTFRPAAALSFDTVNPSKVRFSVAFTPSVSGAVTLLVTVSDDVTACLGYGQVEAVPIARGDTRSVDVTIHHSLAQAQGGGGCPSVAENVGAGADAGSDSAADSSSPGQVTFPGCDPAVPDSCPAGQTCIVDCDVQSASCVAAGTHGPGESCSTSSDCGAGTECFDLSSHAGCTPTTKLCLALCADDTQCAARAGAPADAATPGSFAYPGGSCLTAVECADAVETTYKTCTFTCDPRGAATTGCPSGLLCFLFRGASGLDSPNCGCREPTRTGTDGAPCVSSADCAPGFICNQNGNTLTCRQLCLAGAGSSECALKTCMPLATYPKLGVCL